jgi:hypothetical protein
MISLSSIHGIEELGEHPYGIWIIIVSVDYIVNTIAFALTESRGA